MLWRSERQHWSTLLPLPMDAECRILRVRWLDQLEASPAACSYMVFCYQAYFLPQLCKCMLGQSEHDEHVRC